MAVPVVLLGHIHNSGPITVGLLWLYSAVWQSLWHGLYRPVRVALCSQDGCIDARQGAATTVDADHLRSLTWLPVCAKLRHVWNNYDFSRYDKVPIATKYDAVQISRYDKVPISRYDKVPISRYDNTIRYDKVKSFETFRHSLLKWCGFAMICSPSLRVVNTVCRGGSRYVEGCLGPFAWFFLDLEIYQDPTIVKFRFVGKNLGEADCSWPTKNSKSFKTAHSFQSGLLMFSEFEIYIFVFFRFSDFRNFQDYTIAQLPFLWKPCEKTIVLDPSK